MEPLSEITRAAAIITLLWIWCDVRKLHREMREMLYEDDEDEGDEGDEESDLPPKTPFGIGNSDPGDWWKTRN